MDQDEDGRTAPIGANVLPRARLIEPLTPRELEILGLVCDGYSNREISAQVRICLPTVKYHLLNLFGKLGVRRRTQAVAVALHLRLVAPGWLHGRDWRCGEHLRARREPARGAAALLPDDAADQRLPSTA
ncbi:MAG: hypothetical protein NVS9B10_00550 [Nevskia sp.]